MNPSRVYRRSDLEGLLSSALGGAKAKEVVSTTVTGLRLGTGALDAASARRVLEQISLADGLIGIAGRVALTRLEGSRSPSGTRASVLPKIKRSLVLVAALLAPTLGGERAGTLVREAATSLNLGSDVDLDQALVLLEQIARMPGVTGIAARFAKTRIHLSW